MAKKAINYENLKQFLNSKSSFMHIIKLAKINHSQNAISMCHGYSKQLYRLSRLCNTFSSVFTTKIINIIHIIEIELQ